MGGPLIGKRVEGKTAEEAAAEQAAAIEAAKQAAFDSGVKNWQNYTAPVQDRPGRSATLLNPNNSQKSILGTTTK